MCLEIGICPGYVLTKQAASWSRPRSSLLRSGENRNDSKWKATMFPVISPGLRITRTRTRTSSHCIPTHLINQPLPSLECSEITRNSDPDTSHSRPLSKNQTCRSSLQMAMMKCPEPPISFANSSGFSLLLFTLSKYLIYLSFQDARGPRIYLHRLLGFTA